MAKATLTTEGMSCNHCVKSLTEGLSPLDGIRHVDVNQEAGQAMLEYDEALLDIGAIKAKTLELGYQAR